jgi:acetyl-CoA carboxylase beta subunit
MPVPEGIISTSDVWKQPEQEGYPIKCTGCQEVVVRSNIEHDQAAIDILYHHIQDNCKEKQ